MRSPKVPAFTRSPSFFLCSRTAARSSSIALALSERLMLRFLRSTLMILSDSSWPSESSLRASSTRSMLISDAFSTPVTSSAKRMTASLGSTLSTTPLTSDPRSLMVTKSENGS